jgi:hypothetical protein
MSKQTVVQQLFDWIEANMDEKNFDILAAKEKALAMEKEQIVESHLVGQEVIALYATTGKSSQTSIQYYNETYKGGQDA